MNNPHNQLTKICSSCGQRKSLSAFLYIAGTHGYGNICSTCRKGNQHKSPLEQEDNTRSTTGAKIDAKTVVKDIADKQKIHKQTEEDYFKERDKLEEKNLQRSQKIITTSDSEKKHRKNFLEKRSFLDNKQSVPATQIFGGETHKAEARKLNYAAGLATMTTTTQSSVYKTFVTWLGKDKSKTAPIVSQAEKAALEKNSPQHEADEKAPDPASEFIRKNTNR